MKNVLAVITLAILSVFVLSSCGKDDGPKDALIGTWVDHDRTMILHSDGSGEFLYEDYDWADSERYFTWEATDVMFMLDRGDWGVKSTYLYDVTDNILTLTDVENGSITTYSKKINNNL